MKPTDFEAATVLVPSSDLDLRFHDAVGPHHRTTWKLREQSSRLSAIRDLLLPKLVTGEIDVSMLDLDSVLGETA